MYERSAIVLERYFEKIFGFTKENNLKTNYENYGTIIQEIKEYQKTTDEEEKIILKFDEIANEIETMQVKQAKLHESNIELENERNKIFSDLGENPNTLDIKLQKIENALEKNNEKMKELREGYVKSLVIFTQRQKERNKYARNRRTAETEHMKSVEDTNKFFENINIEDAKRMKSFVETNNENIKQDVINTMIKNGKNEKIPFNQEVIEKAVDRRMKVAKQEAELYLKIFDKTKKLLNDLNNEDIKLSRAEKLYRDVTVKLLFLRAEKEYIVGFLDNERMTVINGKKAHEKLMKEACENFDVDIKQIENLYELLGRETTGKATKKAYKELYNKTYLKNIEEKEKDFEEEVTNIKAKAVTVINSNYWRIEGIKNIYNVFQEEVTEKIGRDLSEYQIEEEPEETFILPQIKEENEYKKISSDEIEDDDYYYKDDDDDYDDYKDEDEEDYDDDNEYDDDEYDDDEYDDDEYDDDEYDDDDYYDDEYDDDEYDDDDYYDDEYDDDEYDDDEYDDDDVVIDNENNDELVEDKIDQIIKNSRKKGIKKNSKNDTNKGGIFNKFFKK